MGTEIERRFLVCGEGWRSAEAVQIRQGYFRVRGNVTVRVRLAGDEGYLTVKGPTIGLTRAEFEYPIPAADAESMLGTLVGASLRKTRHLMRHAGRDWTVDEFHDANEGLVLAEVELESEDAEVELPDWVGDEVSRDPDYFNSALAEHPMQARGS